MEFKIPFSGRGQAYTEAEVQVVVEAMRTANPLSLGKYHRDFQAAFRDYLGVAGAFPVCNGTAALELTAQLCCLAPGDEVVIPSHTYVATALPFLRQGARIVWADIDPDTRVVTAETLAKCLTPRTRVLVAVHLYGFSADMPAIMDLARAYRLLVVEDAAQSLGSGIDGRLTGSFGDFAVFSFHSHKNVSTLGEGGMLVVRDPDLQTRIPSLISNGYGPFPFPREDYWLPAMGNVDLCHWLDHDILPGKYSLGEVQCALGSALLQRADQIAAEKRERALAFMDELRDFPELIFHREASARHNYHLLVAWAKPGPKWRNHLIRTLARDKGVQCVVQYYPLNRYPLFQKTGFSKADCPQADRFFDAMISFPFHHWLSAEDQAYMLAATREILEKIRSESV
ncbi:MAG: DegT/DnrJ/EryC1/StrS family aminotransferase [Magnetococcus sp. DMHC-1]